MPATCHGYRKQEPNMSPVYQLELPFLESGVTRRLLAQSRRRAETEAMRRLWTSMQRNDESKKAIPVTVKSNFTHTKTRIETPNVKQSLRSHTPLTNIVRDTTKWRNEILRNPYTAPGVTFPSLNESPNGLKMNSWMDEIIKTPQARPSYSVQLNLAPDTRFQHTDHVDPRSLLFQVPFGQVPKNEYFISPEWHSESRDWGSKRREKIQLKQQQQLLGPSSQAASKWVDGTALRTFHDVRSGEWTNKRHLIQSF